MKEDEDAALLPSCPRRPASRAALEELTAARRIVAEPRPDGRLTVRWERRQHQVPVAVERRRSAD